MRASSAAISEPLPAITFFNKIKIQLLVLLNL